MPKIEFTCYTCGKEFLRYASAVKRSETNRYYCSRRCHLKGEGNPKWQGGIPEKTCEICGEKYKPIRRGRATISRFCSRKCQNIGHSKEMGGENHPLWGRHSIKKCLTCGREFKTFNSQNKNYCSSKCARIARRKTRLAICPLCGKEFDKIRKQKKQVYCSYECFIKSSKEERICKTCGKSFILNRTSSKEYCSSSCFGKTRIGEKNPRWEGGISYIPYCPKFNDALKEKIRERDGRICQECGCTENENGKKLTVHHIHYDKPNCNPDLIALCLRCNLKANTDKDYWEQYYMEKLKKRGFVNIIP